VTREHAAAIWAGGALASFMLFVLLGNLVTSHGEPAALVNCERSLVNHSTLVAWWLTWACYAKVLIPTCIALIIVAALLPAWRPRILISVVALLLCWRGADLFQHYFSRLRPTDWVVKHETTFSYPSSHAAIAVGFYGLWGALFYLSDLPARPRTILAFLLGIFTLAICWARLALGAHYLTDLIGGALLAVSILCATVAFAVAAFGGVAGVDYRGQNRAV
jgi:membrane-associated phospholipid phosphatase